MSRLREQTGDDTALAIAKHCLAAIAKDLFDGFAGRRLDLAVRIKERQIEPRREAAADIGLARAHQPDPNNRAVWHESRCWRFRSRLWPGLDFCRALLHLSPLFRRARREGTSISRGLFANRCGRSSLARLFCGYGIAPFVAENGGAAAFRNAAVLPLSARRERPQG